MHRVQLSPSFLWHLICIFTKISQQMWFHPCVSAEVLDVRKHAFICLHKSHDVRGLRGHVSALKGTVEEVANCSAEMTLGSGLFIFGQEGA